MNNDNVKELELYVKPGKGWKIAAIVSLILAVIYLVPLPFLSVPCAAFAAFSFWRQQVAKNNFRATLEQTSNGILEDFTISKSLLEGNLRAGNQYLFGKGCKKPVPYTDMKQIYQRVEKTNFIESGRFLIYINSDGKTKTLCKVPLRGKGDEEVMAVFAFIRMKNPNVKLGYK